MSDLISFARAQGLLIDYVPRPSATRWYRFPTEEKPKKKNGALKNLGDVAFIVNFNRPGERATWHPDSSRTHYVEDLALKRRLAAERAQEARERAQAMRKLREAFAALPPLRGGHPYLEAKGLTMEGCFGLRVDHAGRLVIPAYKDGVLMSAQSITASGVKKYARLCPMQGATYVLDRAGASVTVAAEGLSTGLAVFQTLKNSRVIVFFDLGNMVRTLPLIRLSGLVVVAGDNDHATLVRMTELKAQNPHAPTPSNPGLELGEQAARSVGAGFVYPEGIAGSDWADLRIEKPLTAAQEMRRLFMAAARPVFREGVRM